MKILRTPDERFENLPDYVFASNYLNVSLTAFSDGDPVTRGGEAAFQQRVPGCKGLEHPMIRDAGHFLQEDQPARCVDAILTLIRNTS